MCNSAVIRDCGDHFSELPQLISELVTEESD